MSTNSFIGTWKLVSAESKTTSGEVGYPFGKDAAGYLIYGEDGIMAVSIMIAHRVNFASADFRAGSREERLASYDTYLSYCGTYEMKGDIVIHRIKLSLSELERSRSGALLPVFRRSTDVEHAPYGRARRGTDGAIDMAARSDALNPSILTRQW